MSLRMIFECPYCGTRHNAIRWGEISRWECHGCHGTYVSTAMMANYCKGEFMAELHQRLTAAGSSAKLCPVCEKGMVIFDIPCFFRPLGGCTKCHFIWFTPGSETDFLRSSGTIKPEFANVDPDNFPKAFFGTQRDHPIWGGPEQILLWVALMLLSFGVALFFRYRFFS